MTAARWLAAALLTAVVCAGAAKERLAPVYSELSVVNSASNSADGIAPNTIATVYGKNLCWSTRALQASDIRAGQMPTVLPGTGVRVFMGNIAAHIFYASPTQINFLVPSILGAGTVELWVAVDGLAGPAVRVNLAPRGPALFLSGEISANPVSAELRAPAAIATAVDGRVATSESPLQPGDIAVLYATGLGRTSPPADYGRIAASAAWLTELGDFDILLDGARVERGDILYAGLAPSFAGLYQINLRVPRFTADNPEIRLRTGAQTSPAGIRVAFRRAE